MLGVSDIARISAISSIDRRAFENASHRRSFLVALIWFPGLWEEYASKSLRVSFFLDLESRALSLKIEMLSLSTACTAIVQRWAEIRMLFSLIRKSLPDHNVEMRFITIYESKKCWGWWLKNKYQTVAKRAWKWKNRIKWGRRPRLIAFPWHFEAWSIAECYATSELEIRALHNSFNSSEVPLALKEFTQSARKVVCCMDEVAWGEGCSDLFAVLRIFQSIFVAGGFLPIFLPQLPIVLHHYPVNFNNVSVC